MGPKQKRRPVESISAANASLIAKKLKSKRTNESTKLTYSSKVKVMTRWLTDNYPTSITDGKITIPVPKDAVLQFFGAVCARAHDLDASLSDNGDDEGNQPLSVSCVKGYRSALVDLYTQELKSFDSELDSELKILLDGYERTINALRKHGKMKITEGKRHLKSTGYALLAMKLMTQAPSKNAQSWNTSIFSWAYFVVMWNLMSRSDSVDTIMLQHIDWSEDCLVIEEQGHKGDQTGADKFGKHIYANPYSPEQCPILALAILLFTRPHHSKIGEQQLFAGSNSKDRFGKILSMILRGLDDNELRVLGCPAKDIGAHSLRKGSSTFALGQVNGPTPVSVYLRMGQSLGKLKDRYIHFAEGADQLCGRMVAGLPFTDITFGVLPPHFGPAELQLLDDAYFNELVSGFDNYPAGIRSAFPYFLASNVHHEAFLRQHLDEKHTLFNSQVFSQNRCLTKLRGTTHLCCGVCTATRMKASGIPPHLAIAMEVNDLVSEVSRMRTDIEQIQAEVRTTLPNSIAVRVADEIRQNFAIDGVASLTVRDIDVRMAVLRRDIVDEVRKTATQQHVPAEIETDTQNVRWKTWDWEDGTICHYVPQGWEFPKLISTKHLWDLWFFGNSEQQIRPLRQINRRTDMQPRHQMRHSRANVVIKSLLTIIEKAKLLDANKSVWKCTLQQSDDLFEQAYSLMVSEIYEEVPSKGADEISYGRIYNKIVQHRKKGSASHK